MYTHSLLDNGFLNTGEHILVEFLFSADKTM